MIKILLKTCTVMTLLLLPALASAFTTRELSDVAWIATYRTNENFNPTKDVSPITDSHGVTAERIDDTHISVTMWRLIRIASTARLGLLLRGWM